MCWRASSSEYSYQGSPPTIVAAFLDRLLHELGRAGVAHDALLREGHDLDVAVFSHFLAREQKAASRAQAADRSDIGEQAEESRAVHDADLDRAHRARRDLGGIVVALEVVGDLDGFRQRARQVRAHDLAQQALVGMKMQIEKSRQHQAARRVDLFRCLGRELRPDG